MVVPSSAVCFLKAVCVSLETRIMMFLSFLIDSPLYILLYTILTRRRCVVKRLARRAVSLRCVLHFAFVILGEAMA